VLALGEKHARVYGTISAKATTIQMGSRQVLIY